MAKPAEKTATKSRLDKIEIKAIPSEFTNGGWSRVSALITWCFRGTRVSIIEERRAQAVGHGLVADALEATPPDERWNVSTEVVTSYRDITQIRVSMELATSTADEMERARAFLTELTKNVK